MIMHLIGEDYFEHAVGRPPENDDMERVNCTRAGELGHYHCGWCYLCNKPRYMCGHLVNKLHDKNDDPLGDTGCKHNKVYSNVSLMSYPPILSWICSKCGEIGWDRQEVGPTYEEIWKKFKGDQS